MIRFILSTIAQLIANAVALLVSNAFLDDMELSANGFITAVVIFTVAEVLLLPFFRQMALTKANALAGSTALASSLGATELDVGAGDRIVLADPDGNELCVLRAPSTDDRAPRRGAP